MPKNGRKKHVTRATQASTPQASASCPHALSQFKTLVHKELLLEFVAGLRLGTLAPFAAMVLLLFALAVGPEPRLLTRLGAAFAWLALTLGSTLALGAAQAIEEEHGAEEAQRLLGASPIAAFFAKAGVNAALVMVLGIIVAPVAVALLDLGLQGSGLMLGGVLLLGSLAISLPGTLLAALAARTRSGDMLLPLLLFPVLVPGLLAAVRATSLLLLGDPMEELGGWMALLGAFDFVYALLGGVLFAQVLEA